MPTITVKGMSCGHCKQAVTKALEALPGVSDVQVDLATGTASWKETTPLNPEKIRAAIDQAGFDVA